MKKIICDTNVGMTFPSFDTFLSVLLFLFRMKRKIIYIFHILLVSKRTKGHSDKSTRVANDRLKPALEKPVYVREVD